MTLRAPVGGAADRVGARAAVDHHAVLAVGQGLGAGDVGADVVALDHVVEVPESVIRTPYGRCRRSRRGPGRRAAERVGGRAAEDVHAVLAVGQRLVPVTSVPM